LGIAVEAITKADMQPSKMRTETFASRAGMESTVRVTTSGLLHDGRDHRQARGR